MHRLIKYINAVGVFSTCLVLTFLVCWQFKPLWVIPHLRKSFNADLRKVQWHLRLHLTNTCKSWLELNTANQHKCLTSSSHCIFHWSNCHLPILILLQTQFGCYPWRGAFKVCLGLPMLLNLINGMFFIHVQTLKRYQVHYQNGTTEAYCLIRWQSKPILSSPNLTFCKLFCTQSIQQLIISVDHGSRSRY